MPSSVYFLPVKQKEDPSSLAKKVKSLFGESGAGKRLKKGDLIGVKTHFGESSNRTFIYPVCVKAIIDRLLQAGVKPFLTETSTLYRGKRSNAYDHYVLAQDHGFGYERMNVPLIMADGIFGDAEVGMRINGKYFTTVNIAREIAKIDGLIVISHFTGHPQSGFGAAIKNIGMGLASRRGKLKQHSVMSPEINASRCTACGLCIKWCPQNTISMREGKAYIHTENCIGCGECLAVCRYGAVLFDWNRGSDTLQEMMAEHADGVLEAVNGNAFYFNFPINITKNCDCGYGGSTVSPDIGILAGSDIVSVEKASYDLFHQINGKTIGELTYPQINPLVQIEHAEHLGLGTQEYRLIQCG